MPNVIAGSAKEHLFLVDTAPDEKTFRCTNCGVEVTIKLPIQLEYFVQLGKLFRKQHRKCKPMEAQ